MADRVAFDGHVAIQAIARVYLIGGGAAGIYLLLPHAHQRSIIPPLVMVGALVAWAAWLLRQRRTSITMRGLEIRLYAVPVVIAAGNLTAPGFLSSYMFWPWSVAVAAFFLDRQGLLRHTAAVIALSGAVSLAGGVGWVSGAPVPRGEWLRVWFLTAGSVLVVATLVRFFATTLTERERQAREANVDLQRFARLIELSEDFVGMCDLSGRLLHVNGSGRRMVGLGPDEPISHLGLADLCPPEATEVVQHEQLPSLRSSGHWSGESVLRNRADGSLVDVAVSSYLVRAECDGAPAVIATVQRDVTERKRTLEVLQYQATHDGLTGLPNRLLALDRLDHALRLHAPAPAPRPGTSRATTPPGAPALGAGRPGEVAVLLVDLDEFKLLNDSLGHAAGDDLIVDVAERLRALAGPASTVARLGGDEFVIVCEDVRGEDEAAQLADRVASAWTEPFRVRNQSVYITGSVGVALARGRVDAAPVLVQEADAAMYAAKAEGQGRWRLFDASMREAAAERLSLGYDLRQALLDGQITVSYQPIVDLRDASLTGVEALARWTHPQRGRVPPSVFVPVAENIGLVDELGECVLRQACHEVGARQRAGHPDLQVTVNVSAHQLLHAEFVGCVLDAVRSSGLTHGTLGLEITESVVVDDLVTTHSVLSRLRALGIRLLLDDFGTGYSSLSHLRQLPVDAVKLDRSYVSGLTLGGIDAALVEAVVALGRGLALTVVAEGVETDGQAVELRRLGCHRAQGYLFGRPGPMAGVVEV